MTALDRFVVAIDPQRHATSIQNRVVRATDSTDRVALLCDRWQRCDPGSRNDRRTSKSSSCNLCIAVSMLRATTWMVPAMEVLGAMASRMFSAETPQSLAMTSMADSVGNLSDSNTPTATSQHSLSCSDSSIGSRPRSNRIGPLPIAKKSSDCTGHPAYCEPRHDCSGWSVRTKTEFSDGISRQRFGNNRNVGMFGHAET